MFKTSLKIDGNKTTYMTEKISKMFENKYINPKCQRPICKKRVNLLTEYYKKDGFLPLMPVIFCVLNKERYLVDGQHRAESYKKMENKNIEIPIVLIKIEKHSEIKKYFRIINQCVAVSNALFLEDDKKRIILETVEHFNEKYKKIFRLRGKGGRKPNRPYIEKEEFNKKITDYIQEFGDLYNNSDDLIEKLNELNNDYSQKNPNWFPSKGKTKNSNVIKTLLKHGGLYFGMLPNFEWINHLTKNIPEKQIEQQGKTLSTALRNTVWNKWIGQEIGKTKCLCCGINTISQQSWEAGHIKARSMGGSNTTDNLKPICSMCNKSMGNKHMDEFIKSLS